MSDKPKTNGSKQPPSFSMWDDLMAICKDRALDPAVITCPERHKDGVSVVRRSNVLKELRGKGWREESLLTLCPIDRSSYYRAVSR